jgi:hypothetical protein
MVTLDAEKCIAMLVAGRNQRVVNAARRVLDQRHNRTAVVGSQHISGSWNEMKAVGAGVFIRHELAEIGAIERPSIDDLLAMRIDDGDCLANCDQRRLAAAGRNFYPWFTHRYRAPCPIVTAAGRHRRRNVARTAVPVRFPGLKRSDPAGRSR